MALLWLPALDRDEHARSNPWAETSDPKGCLHTTEGGGWPVYDGWTIMPHATIMPLPGSGIRGRQHLPFSQGSFALRNTAGGVQTNRDFVFQFELIGTCNKGGLADEAGAYYWPDADDAVLADLYRKVIKPLSAAYGIPIRSQPWQAYPASYGPRGDTNTVRMSGPSFDGWSGWLGHEHAPENSHGDPGAFPWSRMLEVAQDMALSDSDLEKIEDRFNHALTTKRQVENLPVHAGDPQGDDYTVAGALAFGDRKHDTQSERQQADLDQGAAVIAAVAALQVQMTALTAAVAAIAAGNPDAITAAFAAGAAKLEEQLAALDVHITVGDDTPPA